MKQLTDISPKTIHRVCKDHGVQWESGKQLTEEQVREALKGRTTQEAAAFLAVHPQTLRNRFDFLLDKRRSPGYYEQFRAEIQQIAKETSIAEVAWRFETHRGVIRKVLKRWSEQDARQVESENL